MLKSPGVSAPALLCAITQNGTSLQCCHARKQARWPSPSWAPSLKDLAETHLAGFCDNGGCVSSGHLLPLSVPWDRELARTPPWEPFGLGLLGRGSSILRHGRGDGGRLCPGDVDMGIVPIGETGGPKQGPWKASKKRCYPDPETITCCPEK